MLTGVASSQTSVRKISLERLPSYGEVFSYLITTIHSYLLFTAASASGTCTFALKVTNAVAEGAVAVVIYNSGDDADHMGLVHGTVGEGITVPVFAGNNP